MTLTLSASRLRTLAAGLLAVALVPAAVQAADHIDSPAASAEPTADLTDLFAWTSPDATKLNLVLGVTPFAGDDAQFSDATQYAFHVNSSMGYGEAQTETVVLCQFYDVNAIECWAGDQYLAGDPRDPAGLVSEGGKLRVFADLRNDPFFFEFTGFTNTIAAVIDAAPSLTFDDQGCPALDQATADALVGTLQSGPAGAPASDTFAGSNVLALVVQVDKDVVTPGGPLVGVWASTHAQTSAAASSN